MQALQTWGLDKNELQSCTHIYIRTNSTKFNNVLLLETQKETNYAHPNKCLLVGGGTILKLQGLFIRYSTSFSTCRMLLYCLTIVDFSLV